MCGTSALFPRIERERSMCRAARLGMPQVLKVLSEATRKWARKQVIGYEARYPSRLLRFAQAIHRVDRCRDCRQRCGNEQGEILQALESQRTADAAAQKSGNHQHA